MKYIENTQVYVSLCITQLPKVSSDFQIMTSLIGHVHSNNELCCCKKADLWESKGSQASRQCI